MKLWIGARGADMGAGGVGISSVSVADDGSFSFEGIAAEAPSPTWLAPHPRLDVVYAALEAAGRVAAYSGSDSLTPLGDTIEAGEASCHVAVSPDGSLLVATCWGDGRVVSSRLGADGSLGAPTLAPAASDPYGANRPSRAHSSCFLPDGRVATTDLGYDLVRIWRVTDGVLVPDSEVALPQGSGPRHMSLHADGTLFVVTEYSCEVFALVDDDGWRVSGSVSLDPTEHDSGAEICASPDGALLYAGLRGSDRIAVVRASDLELLTTVDAGVRIPRHHVIAGGRLLVAGEASNEIVALELIEGIPGAVIERCSTPCPQHICERK